ncbi:MAG: hypothetical protein LW878_12195, partial [Proteobacteria bacterium]|jgi:ABC-type proline/glycine betaine transport system permease subunit|nr:hypothetical protein [Pseudomonadota bacterium]
MDALTRVLEVLFSFVSQKTQGLSEEILTVIKMLFMRLFIAAAALAFFCIGLSMVLSKLAQEWEQEILLGCLIAGSSLIVFIIALISGFFKTKKIKTSQGPSPIEQALALLIVDIVEERKAKRTSPQPPAAE